MVMNPALPPVPSVWKAQLLQGRRPGGGVERGRLAQMMIMIYIFMPEVLAVPAAIMRGYPSSSTGSR